MTKNSRKMYNYLKSISVMGYIKLAFSIYFIISGLVDKQLYIAIIGSALFLFTLINKGACPGGSCSVPRRNVRK